MGHLPSGNVVGSVWLLEKMNLQTPTGVGIWEGQVVSAPCLEEFKLRVGEH